jgi:hypothetical protein
MSEIYTLQNRVRMGTATDWERQHLKSLMAEAEYNWQEYSRICEEGQKRRDAAIASHRKPHWLRPMGCDDYLDPRTRRIRQERESFEEQRQRVNRIRP